MFLFLHGHYWLELAAIYHSTFLFPSFPLSSALSLSLTLTSPHLPNLNRRLLAEEQFGTVLTS